MATIINKRMSSDPEALKHLNARFQEMLGRDANIAEIKLFPFLIQSLMDRYFEKFKLYPEERDYIKDYEKKNLIAINDDKQIGCTKEFWDFMCEIVYDRRVCEIE